MGPDRVGRAVVALVAVLAVVLAIVLVVLAARGDGPDPPDDAGATVGEPEGLTEVGAGEDGAGLVTDTVASDAARGGYPLIFQPLNGSGITGTGAVTPGPGGRLTVVFGLEGLTPDVAHAQALHEPGGQAADIRCPTADDDADRDGMLSAREAEAAYGPVRLDLTPYPRAVGGRVEFRGVYVVPRSRRPLIDGAVVIHAAMAGAAEPDVPVACALIIPG